MLGLKECEPPEHSAHLGSLDRKNSGNLLAFSSSSFKPQKAEKAVVVPFVSFLKPPIPARVRTYDVLL
jgi:hypothetical protein